MVQWMCFFFEGWVSIQFCKRVNYAKCLFIYSVRGAQLKWRGNPSSSSITTNTSHSINLFMTFDKFCSSVCCSTVFRVFFSASSSHLYSLFIHFHFEINTEMAWLWKLRKTMHLCITDPLDVYRMLHRWIGSAHAFLDPFMRVPVSVHACYSGRGSAINKQCRCDADHFAWRLQPNKKNQCAMKEAHAQLSRENGKERESVTPNNMKSK